MGDASAIHDFLTTCCDPPVRYGGEPAPGAPAAPRSAWAMEVDVARLLDLCPDLAVLAATHSFVEVLRTVNAEARTLLQGRLGGGDILALRPTHVPPTLAAPTARLSSGTDGPVTYPPAGKLVVIHGTVVRFMAKRVVPATTAMACPVCKEASECASDPFDRGQVRKVQCSGKRCKGAELVATEQVWMDYTECRVQQRGMSDESGRLPRSVTVALDDELAAKCAAGQLVEVVGMAKPRWRQGYSGSVPQIEMIVWALNVVVLDEGGLRPLAGAAGDDLDVSQLVASFEGEKQALRTALLQSTCPQLSGVVGPRLGILLAAVGGAEAKDAKTGHRVRGTLHCLLVGDPSTGKSQLLRFTAAIATRAVFTTGFTSTNAGLTAAATKEFGEWALDPGALVLSDGGACVIDELRTVKAADRTALLEAMEQQTISVAKAGVVARLRTQCSVVAACNPPMKRGSTEKGPVAAEIGVGGPLLSRFDFVFLLWDVASDELDHLIASHILQCSAAAFSPPLSAEQLARYLAHVQRHYSQHGGPLLDDDAADLIGRYYEAQRRRGATPALSDVVPVTVRLLEAMVRIAQAHAKLLLEPLCTVADAAMAIFVMERTAHALKARIHGVVTAAGEQLYTSSKELDDCFLFADPASLAAQERVLQWMVDTFGGLPPPAEANAEALAAVTQHSSTSNGTTSPLSQQEHTHPSSGFGFGGEYAPAHAPSPSCRLSRAPKRSRDDGSLATEYDDAAPELSPVPRQVAVYSEERFHRTAAASQGRATVGAPVWFGACGSTGSTTGVINAEATAGIATRHTKAPPLDVLHRPSSSPPDIFTPGAQQHEHGNPPMEAPPLNTCPATGDPPSSEQRRTAESILSAFRFSFSKK